MQTSNGNETPAVATSPDRSRLLLLQISFAVLAAVAVGMTLAGAGVLVCPLVPLGVWLGVQVGEELELRSNPDDKTMSPAQRLKSAPLFSAAAFLALIAIIIIVIT